MKYYKNENNEIFAYKSDGSQDDYIKPGLTPITLSELEILQAPTAEELAEQTQREAKQTGELYDTTGITVPFTNDVANGLLQIESGFNAAAALVAVGDMSQVDHDAFSANLEISPTVKLTLTPATILPFAAWFWTKRSAFFSA